MKVINALRIFNIIVVAAKNDITGSFDVLPSNQPTESRSRTTLESSTNEALNEVPSRKSSAEVDLETSASEICHRSIQCNSRVSSPSATTTFNPKIDIKFCLLRDGKELTLERIKYLHKKTFDDSLPTKVIIHGFVFNSTEPHTNKVIPAAYAKYHDVNIISGKIILQDYCFLKTLPLTVDWGGKLEGEICSNALTNLVPVIGSTIAEYLDYLINDDPFIWHQVSVIGHSLGAHIAAHVARNVKNGRIASIIGLDPAKPLLMDNLELLLNQDDAEHVEIIHTNSNCYGIKDAIGDADFYVNGGEKQPGCKDDACHHERAVDIFAESIGKSNLLCARRCDRNVELSVRLGGEPNNNHKDVSGSYCLSTHSRPPFGQGSKCKVVERVKRKPRKSALKKNFS